MSERVAGECLMSSRRAIKYLGIDATTLRRWRSSGLIGAFKSSTKPNAGYLYDVGRFLSERRGNGDGGERDVDQLISPPIAPLVGIIYARVSSAKQKPDLERQKQLLRSKYPSYELYSDVASGINFRRPGLSALLERVIRGGVSEVVAASRDRICRFAYDLVDTVLRLHGTSITIVVLDDAPSGLDSSVPRERSFEQELAEDLLAINTVYIARMQGRRAASYRAERKRRESDRAGNEEAKTATDGLFESAERALDEEEGELDTDNSHPIVPSLPTEGDSSEVVRVRPTRLQSRRG